MARTVNRSRDGKPERVNAAGRPSSVLSASTSAVDFANEQKGVRR